MSTPTQLLNAVGWIAYRTNFIQIMTNYSQDKTLDPQTSKQMNEQALAALDEIQMVINTLYVNLARPQPNGTKSVQDLSTMGIV